jgi:hypothetical protein
MVPGQSSSSHEDGPCRAGASGGACDGGQDNSGLEELTTRDDLRGFEPVGRVDIDNGGFCTGALIAA